MTPGGRVRSTSGATPSRHKGLTVWFTGLPSSGKTTLAAALEKRLVSAGRVVEILDGDAVRRHLSADLGFSRADRDENVRRVGYVAHLLSRNGIVVLCALVSPYRRARDEIRALHEARFIEVHVAASAEECARRDVHGLYARQRAGQLHGLTGVDDPYEPPYAAEVILQTHVRPVDECVEAVWRLAVPEPDG